VYEEYRKAGYSRNFKAAHDANIILHQAAKAAFDALGYGKGKKIPTVKTLRAEYAAALEEKKKAYAEYRAAKTEMRELLACREYVERILNAPDRGRERDAEHPEV
jgi:hypothetical protein